MYSQACELLFQTFCPTSPTPAPVSRLCVVTLHLPTVLLATSPLREEDSPDFLKSLPVLVSQSNGPMFLEDMVGWLNKCS